MATAAESHEYSTRQAQCSLECPADSSTAPVAERQLACNVSLQDDSPVLHVVESCSMPHHSGITLRKYALHSVDDDASHTPSQRAVSGGLLATSCRMAACVCQLGHNTATIAVWAQLCEFGLCLHAPTFCSPLHSLLETLTALYTLYHGVLHNLKLKPFCFLPMQLLRQPRLDSCHFMTTPHKQLLAISHRSHVWQLTQTSPLSSQQTRVVGPCYGTLDP